METVFRRPLQPHGEPCCAVLILPSAVFQRATCPPRRDCSPPRTSPRRAMPWRGEAKPSFVGDPIFVPRPRCSPPHGDGTPRSFLAASWPPACPPIVSDELLRLAHSRVRFSPCADSFACLRFHG